METPAQHTKVLTAVLPPGADPLAVGDPSLDLTTAATLGDSLYAAKTPLPDDEDEEDDEDDADEDLDDADEDDDLEDDADEDEDLDEDDDLEDDEDEDDDLDDADEDEEEEEEDDDPKPLRVKTR